MSWFDDTGMHRPHWNLVQAFTLRGKKNIWERRIVPLWLTAKRVLHAPFAVIEPASRIWRSFCDQTKQVRNRALQPDRGGMMARDRRKFPLRTGKCVERDGIGDFIEQGQMDAIRFTPECGERCVGRTEAQ